MHFTGCSKALTVSGNKQQAGGLEFKCCLSGCRCSCLHLPQESLGTKHDCSCLCISHLSPPHPYGQAHTHRQVPCTKASICGSPVLLLVEPVSEDTGVQPGQSETPGETRTEIQVQWQQRREANGTSCLTGKLW